MDIRIRVTVRVRSTQKLPSDRVPERVIPRIRPIATAMPAAAETKFWTVKPTICVRWLTVCSPENHCQLVLVVKLTAALNDPIGETFARSVGLIGSHS